VTTSTDGTGDGGGVNEGGGVKVGCGKVGVGPIGKGEGVGAGVGVGMISHALSNKAHRTAGKSRRMGILRESQKPGTLAVGIINSPALPGK